MIPPLDSEGRPRWNLAAPDLAGAAEALRHGAYLDDIDLFDAEYFGISEEEARCIDPQQRLLLEVTVQALSDANLPRGALRGRSAGIFIGQSVVEYPLAALRNGFTMDRVSPHMATGYLPCSAPGRLGVALGVSGPAMVVDTASSSALVATHLALESLRRKECDFAIVGASHLLLSPYSTAALARAGMLSPNGRCRPFSEEANGHVRAEGCGILILKRQRDAALDGDLPYAILRGSAVFQHGERSSLSSTSGTGQKAVIHAALRSAGVDAADVQYMEAQANGSRMGSVVESESVAEAYGRNATTTPALFLGSCKSNLGYLETASGAAGLIKTALALAHAEIPPQVGIEKLDPNMPWSRTTLRFAHEAIAWPSGARRLAAVNAIGVAGTHAHVIMEGASVAAKPERGGPALLVLSAHTRSALRSTAARLHRHLESELEWSHVTVCRTLADARDRLKIRYAGVVDDRTGLLRALRAAYEATQMPEATPEPADVFVALPELGGRRLRAALAATDAASFEPLRVRVRARAQAMGVALPERLAGSDDILLPKAALAWALGWLDLVVAVGLRVVGCTVGGPWRRSLVDVVTARATGDDVVARALADDAAVHPLSDASLPAPPGWESAATGEEWTLRQAGATQTAPTNLALLDERAWLGLLADRFCAGANLVFSALSTPPRHLCRLPAPSFAGKSYWLDSNRWT